MKISFSIRAFIVYFIILGSLSWFILDNAIERLNDGMRQSSESVIVDIANILASLIEDEMAAQNTSSAISTERLQRVFDKTVKRKLNAQIYQINKTEIDSEVYVTDAKGVVVYDSLNQQVGEDFSRWRDVQRTLEGEYGARTSFVDPERTEEGDEKIMVIAAPIYYADDIVGVVSVIKPIRSLELFLLSESNQLKKYAMVLLMFALMLGYLLSHWFTRSLIKLSEYAKRMARGEKAQQPEFWDERLSNLSDSITYMRNQLDGKEYVESYIHSLTHELKTPITSIRGAAELLNEDLPKAERQKFISNIDTSNRRMARLVDRMLSLAKLEGLQQLVNADEFDVTAEINHLIEERSALLKEKKIEVLLTNQQVFSVYGDKLLIQHAIANILDNAIDFCDQGSNITISTYRQNRHYTIEVVNQGELIPDYALQRLYERFFSLPRPNQKQKSTGLGLSFVYEIMKLHNGTIDLKNTDDGVIATLQWSNK